MEVFSWNANIFTFITYLINKKRPGTLALRDIGVSGRADGWKMKSVDVVIKNNEHHNIILAMEKMLLVSYN